MRRYKDRRLRGAVEHDGVETDNGYALARNEENKPFQQNFNLKEISYYQ